MNILSPSVFVSSSLLVMLAIGCSPRESEPVPDREPSSAAVAPHAASPAVDIPAPAAYPPVEIPSDAPVLGDVHSRLSSGPLAFARLVAMPEGLFLQAGDLSIGTADVEAELQQIPPMHRELLRQHPFSMVEQMAASQLLEQEARRELAAKGQNVEGLPMGDIMQTWIGGLVSTIEATDAEVDAFYAENPELVGGAPLEQIRPQLKQHLTQEKQQEAIEAHVSAVGQRQPIAVNAEWAAAQDAAARNNPVDQARDSGRPTMASFGADSCRPCQMMKPFREAIAVEYEGLLNVVYVHVNKDQMLASRYGVRGIPHMIFFDPDGQVFTSHTGMMTKPEIEAVLADMGVRKE